MLPVNVRRRANKARGDVLAASVVGNRVVLEPVKERTAGDWQRILRETAGVWPDVDPDYVYELRRASRERLEERL